MKYKKKTLSLFKVLKVFDIIGFVCTIISAVGSALSALCLAVFGNNPDLINYVQAGINMISDVLKEYNIPLNANPLDLFTLLAIVSLMAFITSTAVAIMLGLLLNYINTVIKNSSPFNENATSKLTTYGIVFLIMGAVVSVVNAIIEYFALNKVIAIIGQSVGSQLDISSEISVGINSMMVIGLACLLINIIFKYGGELENKLSAVPATLPEVDTKVEAKEITSSDIDSVSISLSDLEKEHKEKKVVVIKK